MSLQHALEYIAGLLPLQSALHCLKMMMLEDQSMHIIWLTVFPQTNHEIINCSIVCIGVACC